MSFQLTLYAQEGGSRLISRMEFRSTSFGFPQMANLPRFQEGGSAVRCSGVEVFAISPKSKKVGSAKAVSLLGPSNLATAFAA